MSVQDLVEEKERREREMVSREYVRGKEGKERGRDDK